MLVPSTAIVHTAWNSCSRQASHITHPEADNHTTDDNMTAGDIYPVARDFGLDIYQVYTTFIYLAPPG